LIRGPGNASCDLPLAVAAVAMGESHCLLACHKAYLCSGPAWLPFDPYVGKRNNSIVELSQLPALNASCLASLIHGIKSHASTSTYQETCFGRRRDMYSHQQHRFVSFSPLQHPSILATLPGLPLRRGCESAFRSPWTLLAGPRPHRDRRRPSPGGTPLDPPSELPSPARQSIPTTRLSRHHSHPLQQIAARYILSIPLYPEQTLLSFSADQAQEQQQEQQHGQPPGRKARARTSIRVPTSDWRLVSPA
jgi:hypothetical protein